MRARDQLLEARQMKNWRAGTAGRLTIEFRTPVPYALTKSPVALPLLDATVFPRFSTNEPKHAPSGH